MIDADRLDEIEASNEDAMNAALSLGIIRQSQALFDAPNHVSQLLDEVRRLRRVEGSALDLPLATERVVAALYEKAVLEGDVEAMFAASLFPSWASLPLNPLSWCPPMVSGL